MLQPDKRLSEQNCGRPTRLSDPEYPLNLPEPEELEFPLNLPEQQEPEF